MCLRPLEELNGVGAEYLVVVADNVNVAAALGAVVLNGILALCALRWRRDLVLLLCLACSDVLMGVSLATRQLGDMFGARFPALGAAAASAALQATLLVAATASLLTVAAIAAGGRWQGPGGLRKQLLLVACVWLSSIVIGTVTVFLNGWTIWSEAGCSLASLVRPAPLVLWACLTHLFVVVVVAAPWGRKHVRPVVIRADAHAAEIPPSSTVGNKELGLAVVIVCYGVCWLPFTVLSLLRWSVLDGSGCCSGVLLHLFFGLGAANYAIKPSLYAWSVLKQRQQRPQQTNATPGQP